MKMAYLVKIAELALNRQNRQMVKRNTNEMAKGPFGKVVMLAKMAEMAINHRNRQTVNKNTNEMAKGPYWKVAILAKMAYLRKMAINCQNHRSVKKIQMRWQRGPLESGDFGEDGVH